MRQGGLSAGYPGFARCAKDNVHTMDHNYCNDYCTAPAHNAKLVGVPLVRTYRLNLNVASKDNIYSLIHMTS